MDDVNLGQKVKHTITGFEGVVIAKTEWLNGCWRITVQSQSMHEGKPIDPQVFDIEELEAIDDKKVTRASSRTGGGRPNTGSRR